MSEKLNNSNKGSDQKGTVRQVEIKMNFTKNRLDYKEIQFDNPF